MEVQEGLNIPLRDGTKLVADLYLPRDADGPLPVILEVTPYERRRGGYYDEAPYWTSHGFAFLAVDARGQGDSEGTFGFFHDTGDDNYDVIEWAAAQPWANGKVGLRGSSFTGSSQYYAAVKNPPSLRCIVPNAVVLRPAEELPRNGGAFKLRWAVEWLAHLSDSGITYSIPGVDGEGGFDYDHILHEGALIDLDEKLTGQDNALFNAFVENDALNAYWQKIAMTAREFSRIDIPVLTFTGWFDGTLPGTVYGYQGVRSHAPADHKAHIVIGPWQHGTLTNGGVDRRTGEPVRNVGLLSFPDHAFLDGRQLTLDFYESCLKDEGEFDHPAAKVYVTGSDIWIEPETYPPPADTRAFYLSAQDGRPVLATPGQLTWSKPGAQTPSHFTYDPHNPVPESVPTPDGGMVRLQSQPVDVTPVQDRDDVLVFESEPLAEPLTVIGNVRLQLWAASDALDTDFTSHLADVRPDGVAIKLGPQSGANGRARYRNSFERETPIVPDEPFEISLDYFDIGHTFQPGHRVRVSVSSSNYPWISANPNTGLPIATDTSPPKAARQTVFHDQVLSSRLMLPVVDLTPYIADTP